MAIVPGRSERLQQELAHLRARYDSGAISEAVYAVMKQLEREIAWEEHRKRDCT
jgi:hypothetical protein